MISGVIDGAISGMEFTNSRGQPGKALRMRLKGKDGSGMRVVLFGEKMNHQCTKYDFPIC